MVGLIDDEQTPLRSHGQGMLRGMVGRNCGLRYAPELRFEEDHSLERGARIEEILRKLPHPDDEGGTGGGEEKG